MEVIIQYAAITALENQTPNNSKVRISISGVNFCIFLLFKLQVQLEKCMEAHPSNQCNQAINVIKVINGTCKSFWLHLEARSLRKDH